MCVGKKIASALILSVLVFSASPAWASNKFLDTLQSMLPSLDFLHSKPLIGEALWKPKPTLAYNNPACAEPLLTHEGRKECLSAKATRLTKNTPHIAPAIVAASPANSWSMAVLDEVNMNFSDGKQVAYADAPPPEASDDDDMKVLPLWRDEIYDRSRSPTAGVTFQSSF